MVEAAQKVTFKNKNISNMMIKTFSTLFLRKSFILLLVLYIFCHAKNCHDSCLPETGHPIEALMQLRTDPYQVEWLGATKNGGINKWRTGVKKRLYLG